MLTPSPTPTPGTPAEIPELARFLQESARSFALELPLATAERLVTHAQKVLEASQSINVVGVKTLPEAVLRLVCDSLVVAPHLASLPTASVVVDFGTGGGFPGVPLAMVCPSLTFLLVESRQKKLAVALREAERAGVNNVRGQGGRLAELSKRGGPLHARSEVIVTRAVASLPDLFLECRTALRPSGMLWVWKGDPLPSDEALAWPKAASNLGYQLEVDQPYQVYRPSRLLGFRRHDS